MSGQPDPKPTRERLGGGRTLRSQVYDRGASRRKLLTEPFCRIPGCAKPVNGCHHLVPKGSPHFGDDVVENLIPLCGSGTSGHHGKIEQRDPLVSTLLGENLTDGELAYVRKHLGVAAGDEFLRRRYHRSA